MKKIVRVLSCWIAKQLTFTKLIVLWILYNGVGWIDQSYALAWAVSEEIISDDKTPDRHQTKEEIVTILYRFKKVMEGVK